MDRAVLLHFHHRTVSVGLQFKILCVLLSELTLQQPGSEKSPPAALEGSPPAVALQTRGF